MNSYYVTWHTWHIGQVQTPWEFWYLSKGTHRKPVHDTLPAWDPTWAQEAFESQDVEKLQQLDASYVPDLKLMAFLHAQHETHVREQITQLFPDAVFDRITPVSDAIRNQILELIVQTLHKSPR